LEEYGIGKHDAGRWAEYCQGCPRVAHVIGENLRQNRADVLQPPATVNLWDRFIVGHDDPSSEEVQLRKIVLRYVSLFERFGFEPPVDAEAQFIASMAEACDSRLTWPRFQSLIASLKQRRIIQGATTLYITPRLLHVHLYRDFWRSYGSGFDIAGALQNMPGQIRHWFIAMLRYADDSPTAQAAVEAADLICTTTSAREPVLKGEWIAPGAHINAVGSSVAFARELDTAAMVRSRLFVDRRESTLNESGDFLFPKKEGAIGDAHIQAEIGELLLGQMSGRQSPDEITLFKSLGLAIEDLASAHHIYTKAVEKKVGTWLPIGGQHG